MKATFLILIIGFVSCKTQYKECECNHSDIETAIYNEILIQIVEQHSYNAYLGKTAYETNDESLDEATNIEKQKIENMKLQNKLFGDSTNFRTVYIADTCKSSDALELLKKKYYFGIRGYSFVDTTISKVFDDKKVVEDTLSQLQENLQIEQFHACTFKIMPLSKAKKKDVYSGIGVIYFSKLFLNKTKDAGLMIYEDESVRNDKDRWGKQRLIYYKKIDQHWKIINIMILGIS